MCGDSFVATNQTVVPCPHAALARLDYMMTSSNGNIFRVTSPLLGESIEHRCIPLTKACDAEIWCFLWSAAEQTVEQTIETPVIWDATMRSLWRHCNDTDSRFAMACLLHLGFRRFKKKIRLGLTGPQVELWPCPRSVPLMTDSNFNPGMDM